MTQIKKQILARLLLRTFTAFVLSFGLNSVLLAQALEYAPSPIDNPLKGLVPYQADVRAFFPHSMEFNYLPYAASLLAFWKRNLNSRGLNRASTHY